MESSSEANKIHFSRAAYEELQRENSLLPVVSRGFIDVKGKGKLALTMRGREQRMRSMGSEGQATQGRVMCQSASAN